MPWWLSRKLSLLFWLLFSCLPSKGITFCDVTWAACLESYPWVVSLRRVQALTSTHRYSINEVQCFESFKGLKFYFSYSHKSPVRKKAMSLSPLNKHNITISKTEVQGPELKWPIKLRAHRLLSMLGGLVWINASFVWYSNSNVFTWRHFLILKGFVLKL